MPVFDYMPMGEDGLQEIFSWMDEFVLTHKEIAEKRVLGRSEDERWEIPAIVVTNKDVPGEEKQTALITLSRHGHERGTRVVGPEILSYLASPEARTLRDRQTVVVVPVVNPEGVVQDSFHSSMSGITELEKKIFGRLCAEFPPDMMIDFHSLGKTDGSKYDLGDMEVIVPANTTTWGMDEQIHQYVAHKMQNYAEEHGWPYEVHTLEDLSAYYFGGRDGRLPHASLQEKTFLLQVQNPYEQFAFPEDFPGYTNYTCGPAYLRWHTMVFGMETNHFSIRPDQGLGESGMLPCRALLEMGNQRFAWERAPGYPTNLLCGDFRISLRPIGENPGQLRTSRERLWKERFFFDVLKRETIDAKTTVAEVGYLGDNLPLDLALCLRMRQKDIHRVCIHEEDAAFETFTDHCSTFVHIPLRLQAAGRTKVTIEHGA